MLSVSTVLEIRRLLDEGELSQRAIAAKLGVSRDTVSAVAAGRRALHGREPHPRRGFRRIEVEARPLPARCPGCGGLVYLPCRLCRVREYRRRLKIIRGLTRPNPDPRRIA